MNPLRSQSLLKDLLAGYYRGLKSPLAWCTSAGPAELLRALGFQVYFPENHAAILGASRLSQRYIPRAHQAGYAGEVCSYLTADIGAWLLRETPLTGAYGLESIPRPDLIVYCTNQCREVAEWFNFFGREFDVPVAGIFPPRHLEQVAAADLNPVIAQYRQLITLGEQLLGTRLQEDRLQAVLSLSQHGSRLWRQVLEAARRTPAPLTFFDGCILMAPIVILRGTQDCVDFYRQVLEELQTRQEQNRGAVPAETVRLFWEGMPIWGRLKALAEFFSSQQTAVVASTYCNSWIFEDFDPGRPLESLAEAYTRIFINRGEKYKLQTLARWLRDFSVDGIVFHDAKTCFNNTNCRFGMPVLLGAETGLPALTIDGDLNDLRFFSDGQTRTRLETFIEQIREHKASRGSTT